MGKTTEDIKISLNVSLKGSPKGVFPIKNFEIKFFILNFAKKTLLFTQKLKINIFTLKVMSVLQTAKIKTDRKPYLLSRNAHFAKKNTLYRLFVVYGELSMHFSLSKG